MIRTPGYTWRKTARSHSEPGYRMYSGGDRVASVDYNDRQKLWTWRSEQYSWLFQSSPSATSDEAKIACATAHTQAAKLGGAPDLEDESPDPDTEEALSGYIAMLKATMPSEETKKAVFDAAGGRCECIRTCCDHGGRCARTLDWRDRSPSKGTGYVHWEAVSKPGSESSHEIVCVPCQSTRYEARHDQM